MSGTASRFQTRFAYNPALRSGAYPTAPAAPPVDPTANGPNPASLPGAAVTPTAPAPQPGVVMAGSVGDNFGNDGGEQGGRNDSRDLGPEPGNMLGGGLSGFGVSNYGTLGGVLGGLAGMALGVPGLGLAATALGTDEDVRSLNGQLSMMGLAPEINFGDAMLSNSTFGLLGSSPNRQFNTISDRYFDALDPPPDIAQPVGTFVGPSFNAGDISTVSPATLGPQFSTTPEVTMTFDPTNAVFSSGGGTPAGAAASGNTWGGGAGDMSAGADSGWGDPGTPYMTGGYTGGGDDGQVQPDQPAGTVHEGEVVIPAHQVARYGLPALMALVEGSVEPSMLARLAKGWATDNTIGVSLRITLAAGATFQGVSGWQAGTFLTLAGQTNLMATGSATLELFDCGLYVDVAGAGVAPPFEVPDLSEELRRCQRYYAKTFNQATAPAQNAGLAGALFAVSYAAGGLGATWQFPVEMRVAPALASYNPSAANANWRDTTNSTDRTAIAASAIGTTAADIRASDSASGAAWNYVHLTADARL